MTTARELVIVSLLEKAARIGKPTRTASTRCPLTRAVAHPPRGESERT